MNRFTLHARLSLRARAARFVRGGLISAVALTSLAAAPLLADVRLSQADSDALQRKLLQIVATGGLTPAPAPAAPASAGKSAPPDTVARARQTPILEREVNSYIRFALREQVPAGVIDPLITIVGDGRVTGTAMVDLDEVKKSQKSSRGGLFDPMSYIGGQLPVTATGTLQTENGTGRFLLESASISGVPVPKSVLQQVVSYYSRTPENPAGLSLDDAFELPARIREIRVQPGQAIVVQ